MPKIKTLRDKEHQETITVSTVEEQLVQALENILIVDIIPSPLNPRKVFDEAELKELSDSIVKTGLIQAITIRPSAIQKGKYEIVCGERRWRASMLGKLATILASVRSLTDQEAMELMVTENLQRKDVHAMEECNAFHMMLDKMSYSITDIAAKMGKPEAFIYRRLQLSELIPELKVIFQNEELPIGHAELLSRIAQADQLIWFTTKYSAQWSGGAGVIKDLRKWINDSAEPLLSNAKFDICKIFEGEQFISPTCTVCRLNSAVNFSLFPDQADQATCHNSHCYEAKEEYTFNALLNMAMEDTSTIFIDEYYGERLPLKAELKAAGYTVLKKYEDYDKVAYSEPHKYSESEEHYQLKVKTAKEHYQKELAKSVKAFIFGGEERGRYIDITLRKAAIKSDGDKLLDNKIGELKTKISRGLELDAEKVMTRLVDHMKVLPEAIKANDLSKHEHDCLVVMCYEKSGSSKAINKALGLGDNFYSYNNGQALLEAISKANDEIRSLIIRRSIHFSHTSILPAGVAGAVNTHLAKDWCPDTLKQFNDEQDVIRKKREDRLNERIAEITKNSGNA